MGLASSDNVYLYSATRLQDVLAEIISMQPRAVIVDSIQTVYLDDVNGSAGSVSQVSSCCLTCGCTAACSLPLVLCVCVSVPSLARQDLCHTHLAIAGRCSFHSCRVSVPVRDSGVQASARASACFSRLAFCFCTYADAYLDSVCATVRRDRQSSYRPVSCTLFAGFVNGIIWDCSFTVLLQMAATADVHASMSSVLQVCPCFRICCQHCLMSPLIKAYQQRMLSAGRPQWHEFLHHSYLESRECGRHQATSIIVTLQWLMPFQACL